MRGCVRGRPAEERCVSGWGALWMLVVLVVLLIARAAHAVPVDAFAPPVLAQANDRWEYLGMDASEGRYYLDTRTVVRPSAEEACFWWKVVHTGADGRQWQVLQRYWINGPARRYQPLSPSSGSSQDVPPDTMMEAFLERLFRGGSAYVPPTASAPSSSVSEIVLVQARETMLHFYKDLRDGDFKGAYERLSPGWRAQLSLWQFCWGYQASRDFEFTNPTPVSVSDRRVVLALRVAATDHGVRKHYQCTYTLVGSAGAGFTIDSGRQILLYSERVR